MEDDQKLVVSQGICNSHDAIGHCLEVRKKGSKVIVKTQDNQLLKGFS